MNNICNNSILIKYFLIVLKYFIPILLIMLGLIKLIVITNKRKALNRFIKFITIGLVLIFIGIFVETQLKDKCNEYNKEEVKKEENIIQDKQEESVFQSSDQAPLESKVEVIDGVTYVDGILIVNKTYSIPSSYQPSNAGNYQYCNSCLTDETLNAFREMQSDATALGLNIYISSGYRSYDYQNSLYNNYVSIDGKEAADKYSARPGHSEHQTGLAFDLNTIDDSFANTAEGKWVSENCWRYGLILRYPKGKEDKTGYQYESWHLRYVGSTLALELYNNGNWITVEEYFNLTSVYSNA